MQDEPQCNDRRSGHAALCQRRQHACAKLVRETVQSRRNTSPARSSISERRQASDPADSESDPCALTR
eukprot:393322-Prymnesium_polylepis.1